jgi:hypothetical protein
MDPREFDIVEIPLEGVAAYWLSLKKIVEGKKNFKGLEPEVEHTQEPYINHLLEGMCANLPDPLFRKLAVFKREALLDALQSKFDLIRMGLLDILASENPRKTLAKMTAQYATAPINEEKAFQLVQEMIRQAANPGERPRIFNVDHKLKPEQLIVALLFYVAWARKEGKMALQPFLEFVRCEFFRDGLALVIDGFDAPFVRKRLRVHRDAILASARLKMEMSAEMSCGIRDRYEYEDVFRIAKAFMS